MTTDNVVLGLQGSGRKIKFVMGLGILVSGALLAYLLSQAGVMLRGLYDVLAQSFEQPAEGLKLLSVVQMLGLLTLQLLAAHSTVAARRDLNAGTLRILEAPAVAESYLWAAIALTFGVYGVDSLVYLKWLAQAKAPSDLNLFVAVGVSFFICICVQLLALIVSFGRRTSSYKHALAGLHAYMGIPVLFPLVMGASARNVLLFAGTWLISLAIQPMGERLWRDVQQAHASAREREF